MILEKIVCSIANDTENDPYLISDIKWLLMSWWKGFWTVAEYLVTFTLLKDVKLELHLAK